MRRVVIPILAAALAPLGAHPAKPSAVRSFTIAPGRTISVMASQKLRLLYEQQGPRLVILDPASLPAPARDILPCETASGAATVSWRALKRRIQDLPLTPEKGDALFQGWLERQGKRWVLQQGSRPPADRPGPVGVDTDGSSPAGDLGFYVLMGLPDPPPEPGPILVLGHVDPGAATVEQRGEAVLAVKAWARP